jgi:glycosyltransferase involved in cell wall biosynthesis
MHVLHVISGLGTGGAESFLATLAPRLLALGLEQAVVSLTGDGPLAARLEAGGVPVVRLDVRSPSGMALTVRSLRALVAKLQPGVIQGWMYHGDLFATLAHKLASGRPRRLYWNIRCSDMQLSNYSTQLRMVVKACTWASAIPDAVLANSAAGARVHVAAGYRPRQVLVLPNGVDCKRFSRNEAAGSEVRSELALTSGDVVVLHVARVDPMKDHKTLLDAAGRLQRARLVIVGNGTEKLDLPPGVIALGQRSDIPRLLNAADIIVSSSAYGEGFSNAIAEGMAAGLVPVATGVGDAAEIVDECGSLVPPRDAAALAAALQKIIDLPPEERTRRGTLARERICARYSLDQAVERFAALYTGQPART